MTTEPAKDVNRIFFERPDLIHEAVKEGVRDALHRHEVKGELVVIYRDGKTVWIRPENRFS